jgi:hypothetical protein
MAAFVEDGEVERISAQLQALRLLATPETCAVR